MENTPQITYEEGYKMLDIKRTTKVVSTELVIWALTDGEGLLCWKYVIEDVNPVNNKVIYVNATDGTLVWEGQLFFSGIDGTGERNSSWE